MAVVLIQCSRQDCRNSFSHDDAMESDAVELMALENGWTKQPDGSWHGCPTSEGCPLVHRPEAAPEPRQGLAQLAAKRPSNESP